MKTIREAGDLKDKKVLLRVDFDVPVDGDGQIEEPFRIKKQKEMLDWLVAQGAKVIMIAHISDKSVEESFSSLIPQLHILLGHEINFIKTVAEIAPYLDHYVGPALVDNIRKNEGEKENDPDFAKQLAGGFDLYVNNDFAVCHRDHASVSGITKFLPSYAGFIIEEETGRLGQVVTEQKEGKVVIIGGAKTESKVPVIRHMIDKAESILLGGVVANDVLKVKGQEVGQSKVDENASELFVGLDLNDPRIVMPEDFVWNENKILDIGEGAVVNFVERIKNARMIIWNGPMGMFEDSRFSGGTNRVAQAIAESSAVKIIGGGDTISAVNRIKLLDKFDFVSTGGGAMLAFLGGDKLPGLDAVGYYE